MTTVFPRYGKIKHVPNQQPVDDLGNLRLEHGDLASGDVNSLLLNMAIEIVDLSMNSMVIFNSHVAVYQRVICKSSKPIGSRG